MEANSSQVTPARGRSFRNILLDVSLDCPVPHFPSVGIQVIAVLAGRSLGRHKICLAVVNLRSDIMS